MKQINKAKDTINKVKKFLRSNKAKQMLMSHPKGTVSSPRVRNIQVELASCICLELATFETICSYTFFGEKKTEIEKWSFNGVSFQNLSL